MAQVISGTVTQTVTLSSNPTTITSAGSITAAAGPALAGNAGAGEPTAGWTVSNAGSVTATATKADAIDLAGGGSIGNTGMISGYNNGIAITGGLGTVTNSGTLESSPTVIVPDAPGNVYDGVYLAEGGSVTNAASGEIFGGTGGVYINGDVGTVTNAGDIHTTTLNGIAVFLHDGGTVNNTGTGSIYGDFSGISVYSAAGTITNAGTITAYGLYAYGVDLDSGGVITNTGSIMGSDGGVYSGAGGPLSLTNTGYIYGSNTGLNLYGDGRVTNAAGGIILGKVGITLASGTISNFGTIAAVRAGGKAITFTTESAADRLIVNAGAVFTGLVTGGGANSVLELTANGLGNTLTGVGTSITNFDTVAFDASASWTVDETLAGLNGEDVTGFTSIDRFVLGVTGVTGSFDAATETLTLTSGSDTSIVQFGSVALGGSILVQAVGNETDISLVPCFAAGTRIATPKGGVAIETLAAGDQVLTSQGESLAIIWTGHRFVDCDLHPKPDDVRPIMIREGAFAEGIPRRDLFLSPDHAIFARDVLIPVKHLVNDTTILSSDIRRVTYHHIELERHAVILADGLPAESYLDTGDRPCFTVEGAPQVLHPVFGNHSPECQLIWEALGCAPLRVVGPDVDQVRADLALRADKLRAAASFSRSLARVA